MLSPSAPDAPRALLRHVQHLLTILVLDNDSPPAALVELHVPMTLPDLARVQHIIKMRVAEQEKQTSLEDLKNEEEAWSGDHVTPPGAFFSYTSNVDAHFYDVLDAGEIRECHGNVELYQCGGRRVVVEDEEEGEKVLYMSKKCSRSVWRAPSNLAPYAVSTETMLAEDGATALSLAAKTDVEIRRRSATRVGRRGIRRPAPAHAAASA